MSPRPMRCKYCSSRRVKAEIASWHHPVVVVSGWCQDCGRYGYFNGIAEPRNTTEVVVVDRSPSSEGTLTSSSG